MGYHLPVFMSCHYRPLPLFPTPTQHSLAHPTCLATIIGCPLPAIRYPLSAAAHLHAFMHICILRTAGQRYGTIVPICRAALSPCTCVRTYAYMYVCMCAAWVFQGVRSSLPSTHVAPPTHVRLREASALAAFSGSEGRER